MTDGGPPTAADVLYVRYSRQLHVLRLDVTRTQWEHGLALCAGRMPPHQAAATQYALLYRLTPYWRVVNGWLADQPVPPIEPFQGWDRFRVELEQDVRGLTTVDRWHFLQVVFGPDAVPMAGVILST